jgi:hypothetical protein
LNRAVATVLTLVCASMTMQAGLAPAGLAQVAEPPEDKQRRIDRYQDLRLIFEQSPGPDKSPRPGQAASPAPIGDYSLRQGPDAIYDVDFVELMDDPSLTNFWLGERNRDWAFWLGSGAVAVPAGTMLFLNNFRGQGPLAFFVDRSQQGTIPNAAQAAAVSDWRTFALSVAGVTLATYGAYNLTQWVLETLDVNHPNRLDADSIRPRVDDWNERLRERLNLELADIPPAPTPRPSPTPTPSASPDADGGAGADPDAMQQPTDDQPPAPVGGPNSYPEGAPPQDAIPVPLPVISPGQVPAPRASLSPSPTPSVFWFPGFPRQGDSSPTPGPTAQPSPAGSPR